MVGLGRFRERHLLGLAGDDVHCASEISTLDSGDHRRKATKTLTPCLQTRCSQRRTDAEDVGITPIHSNLGFRLETITNPREGKGGVYALGDASKEGNDAHGRHRRQSKNRHDFRRSTTSHPTGLD